MLFSTGQLIRRATSARNLHRSRRAGELGCRCRHGPPNTFRNAFARSAIDETFTNDFFRMAFCYIMRPCGCVRCLHCPAADYCAAACASAKFSKCHPNRHISFPVFYATQSLKVQKIMGAFKTLRDIPTPLHLQKAGTSCKSINLDSISTYPVYHNIPRIVMVNVSFRACLHWED